MYSPKDDHDIFMMAQSAVRPSHGRAPVVRLHQHQRPDLHLTSLCQLSAKPSPSSAPSATTLTTNGLDTGSRSTAGLHHVAAGLVFGAAGGTVATVAYSTSTETFWCRQVWWQWIGNMEPAIWWAFFTAALHFSMSWLPGWGLLQKKSENAFFFCFREARPCLSRKQNHASCGSKIRKKIDFPRNKFAFFTEAQKNSCKIC